MTAEEHTGLSDARRIEAAILKAVESAGHAAVARALQVDESYVSKLKGTDQKITFASISAMLAAVGLNVVPAGARHITESRYQALISLAEEGFAALKDDPISFGQKP